MARTFIRQATQIRRSEAYDDTLSFGPTLEQGAVSIEDDLNSLRSQIKRILDGTGAGKWHDNVPSLGGNPAGLLQVHQSVQQLQTNVGSLGDRKLLVRAQVIADVAVPANQNYVRLTAAQAPTVPASLDPETNGAIVASVEGLGNYTDVVAGPNALNPKNLVLVRDADTGEVLQSEDRDVYGLLQVPDNIVDGATFTDDDYAQISFVRVNAARTGLEAVDSADIGGRTINYSYVIRGDLGSLPEESFLTSGTFTDLTAEVDVTLTRAIANQQGPAPAAGGINIEFAAGGLQLSSENGVVFDLDPHGGEGGGGFTFTGDSVDLNANMLDLSGFGSFDTARTPIHVGRTPGYIVTDAGNSLGLRAGDALYLADANITGSNWTEASGLALATNQTDWNRFAEKFPNRSLLGAIYDATLAGARAVKAYATVTANIAANSDVGGANGGGNLDVALPSLNGGQFLRDFDVYVNGELQRPGADENSNNDYYPGTNLSQGQIRMEYDLRVGDVICVAYYADPATFA